MHILHFAPIVGFCVCSMFCCSLICVLSSFANHVDGEEGAGCFTLFVFMLSCDDYCYVALPHGAVDSSAVSDCGIS